MIPLVTIGIPVYKRLHFLPNVLKSISQQEYPNLEVIVSDNGLNGEALPAIVHEHFAGNITVRRNPMIATMSTHFNQIIAAASGKYFMVLCDDDEISPTYVSELVRLLEDHPQASIALSRQEMIDESGAPLRWSSAIVPTLISGPAFVKAAWETQEFQYEGFATFLGRTDQIKKCGGFPEIHKGMSHDDALLLKLCLDSYVAMSSRCTFRFRLYESSHGATISLEDVRQATVDFLSFLKSDPCLQRFAAAQPSTWKEVRQIAQRMNWEFYHQRWAEVHRQTATTYEWIKAAFALPFIPGYYMRVATTLTHNPTMRMASVLKALLVH